MARNDRHADKKTTSDAARASGKLQRTDDAPPKPRYFEFPVISGELKGKVIRAPDLGITRPPLTRLRKSIFDFLMPYLPDARYLDLFSGTGSYLFEAVSRGAGKAVGIERDPQLAKAINDQAKFFGVADRLQCYLNDVFVLLPQLARHEETFDIIMMAPPQYLGLVNQTLRVLRDNPTVCTEALILCQTDTSELRHLKLDGFELQQERKYGNTTYTVVRMAGGEGTEPATSEPDSEKA